MLDALEAYDERVTILHSGPEWEMDDDELFHFCQCNKDLRVERTADGDILIMSPEGWDSCAGNTELITVFNVWAKRDGTGRAFGATGGLFLPNTALRSPDVWWISNKRAAQVPQKQKQGFPRICPDFVLELRSKSDRLAGLQRKMEEYLENGARLGWLLDPVTKSVHLYRPDEAPQVLKNPATVSGEPVLRGFVLDVRQIWAAIKV